MRTTRFPRTSLLFGILTATFCLSASAHPDGAAQGDNGAAANNAPEATTTPARAAPPYDSDTGLETLSSGNFNTPEADGRPGEYYFQLGADAFKRSDYRHAIAMYQVAASWAYKPAEYNLALMYFRGEGVPVNRARGVAWMVLAAERNTPLYVHARNLMVTALSNAEFDRTNDIWGQLKPTYGDEVALHRAKARWSDVKASMTGSRVGDGAVNLIVGAGDGVDGPPVLGQGPVATSGAGLFKGQTTDGAIAYRQFQQSDNPYDPVFLKDRTGTVTVGPLMPVKSNDSDSTSNKSGDSPQHL